MTRPSAEEGLPSPPLPLPLLCLCLGRKSPRGRGAVHDTVRETSQGVLQGTQARNARGQRQLEDFAVWLLLKGPCQLLPLAVLQLAEVPPPVRADNLGKEFCAGPVGLVACKHPEED